MKESLNTRSGKTATKILLVTCVLFLFAIMPIAFLARPVVAAQAVVVYVSPTGSDTSGDGSLLQPYATITHGVASAPAGAIVLVGPGTYHEMVNITQQITLQSQSSDPSNTIIDANGLSMGIFVRGPSAAGTIIQGFTVENANNHGIYAQDTSNIIIEHNIVTSNGVNPTKAFSGEDKAINLVGTSYSVIAGNTVVANQYGGIAVNDNGPLNPGFYSPGTLNAAVGNVISGNIVVGNHPKHCSIVVSAYDEGAGVINNIVSNNVVVDNSAGIVVAANLPNTQAVNNSVIFNTILNNGEAGVVLHANAPGALNSGTVVMGNTISGNGFAADISWYFPKQTGVLVGGESKVTMIQRASITSNVFHNQYYGVYLVNTTQTTVLSNTVDQSVTIPVKGAPVSQDPLSVQISSLSSTIASVQSSLNQLQSSAAKGSDVSSLSTTVNSLSSTLNQLQSTLNQLQSGTAKTSDLSSVSSAVNDLSSTVSGLQSSAVKQSDLNSLSGNVANTSYVAYAALAVAIVLGAAALALSRRRPSPAK